MIKANMSDYFYTDDEKRLIVHRVFHYLGNYLLEHDEKDVVDMDFLEDIIQYIDIALVSKDLVREEYGLFNERAPLSIPESIQEHFRKVTQSHHALNRLVSDISLLINKYNLGYISGLDDIHSMLKILVQSFYNLTQEQAQLFLEMDAFLSDPPKGKLNLLKSNEISSHAFPHHPILEKYNKYNTLPV